MILIITIAIFLILIILGAETNVFASEGIVGTSFDNLIEKWASIRTNLDTTEIKASIQTESSGNPNALNPNDPSWGLMGVTQLIANYYLGSLANDGTWKTDPDLNIQAGSGFLSDLKTKYESDYPLDDSQNGWIQIYNVGETKFRKGIRNPGYQSTWLKWFNLFTSQGG